jgi:hypothetical protein
MRKSLFVTPVCGLALALTPAVCEADARELDCKLRKTEQRLDYEFRTIVNYVIRVPAKQFGGEEVSYRLRSSVRAVEPAGEFPAIISRSRRRMPAVPEDAEEMIQFANVFAFGQGTYEAEWRLELEDGRACQVNWAIDVKRRKKFQQLPSPLGAGEVEDVRRAMYRPENSVIGAGRPLRVKVFLNLDRPQRKRPVRVGPIGDIEQDIRAPRSGGRGGGGGGARGRGGRGGRGRGGGRRGALRPNWAYYIGVLRSLSRDPRVGEVALVTYSVEDQKTLLRHDFRSGFDYPGLRGVNEQLDPNTVDVGDLDPESDNDFLGELLVREIAEAAAPDVHIFIGPEAQYGEKPSARSLEAIGKVATPLFLLNHQRGPNWGGLIKNSVKALGGKELAVQSPEDLWKAMQKMLGRREGLQ